MTVEAKKAEYFRLLKLWDQAMDYHESLLRANSDQWSSYVHYVEAAFASTDRDSALNRAKNLIVSLAEQEKEKKENKLRGPYLARLYFWQELKKNDLDPSLLLGTFLHLKIHSLYTTTVFCYRKLQDIRSRIHRCTW